MKVSDVYQSNFLKGSDLTQPVRVSIAAVEVLDFKDQQSGETQPRIVLGFRKAKKRLVLNKTQARACAVALTDDDTDNWIGKEIVLSPGLSPNGQRTVVISPIAPATSDDDRMF